MVGAISRPDTREKLEILSADAKYDLACACGGGKDEHRRRSGEGRWIYPVTMTNGGKSVLFKTLLSNVCTNDCKYCPLREQEDVRRCSLGAEETARVFLDYYRKGKVFGLFLSSGVMGTADATMERLNATTRLLRKRYGYRGYIHLKVIPGASAGAIEEAVSLSSAVSLNIETPGAANLAKLSKKKRYLEDIIEPMKLISRLTGRGGKFEGVKQTTQFIVGAAGEKDAEIVKYMWGLYKRLGLQRVYFSAYQRQSKGREAAEGARGGDILTREHRLYQVDFLVRRYGFGEGDIEFDESGNLGLECDPKEAWARRHPEAFPVEANRAGYYELLRVPGVGPVTAKRIVSRRREGRLRRIEDVGRASARLQKAGRYLVF